MRKQKKLVLASFGLMLVLATGCSDAPAEVSTKIEVKIPEQQNKFLQITGLPTANYTEFDDDIYMYEVPPSEKDISEGKILGSISQFKYLGQDKYGFHKIGLFLDEYGIISVKKCKNPCKVIYSSEEKIPYNNNTIIGSVFEDALNGRLSIAKNYSYLDEEKFNDGVLARRTDSLPKEFQCNWSAKGYNGRPESFFIFNKRNAMAVTESTGTIYIKEIQHIDVKNTNNWNEYVYDIIVSENKQKLTIAFDWKSKRMMGKTTDNQWTEFTAKDCREDT